MKNLITTISPSGALSVGEGPDDGDREHLNSFGDGAALEGMQAAFADSSAAGLLKLASADLSHELPPALVYWRGLARDLFQAVCHLGESGIAQWKSVPPPSDERLAELVAEAPPMRGLEYLNAELLRRLWTELRVLIAAEAERFPQGPAAWLREVNPLWHLVGRVTFHLAENKRDEQRPFAFLATYSHRMSAQSKVQHLPLAEALKTYAGAKDRARLESLLEPVRRAADRSPLARELLDHKALFAPQAWTIRQAYRLLSEAPRIEEAGVVLRLPDWWSARKPPRPQVQVRIGQKRASEVGTDRLLDFEVGVALDGEPLTAAERRKLLDGVDELVLLRGKWVEVDRQKLEQALDHWKTLQSGHPDGVSFLEGMRLLSNVPLDGAQEATDEVAPWSRITAGGWLKETLEHLRRPDQIDGCRPGHDLQATLRPYQADGVRWLWFMTELGLGACLADDMGLGKTIQIIDLLLQRRRPEGRGAEDLSPSLLVVPASLLGNWRQEIERFAPQLKFLVVHRSEADDDSLRKLADDPRAALQGLDLVMTTYGLVRRQKWLEAVHWSTIILDEAQAIKNAGSAQTRSVKKLKSAQRIVLTGTPVENHLGDLWSLFDFCSPGLLGSAAQFKQFVKRLNQSQDPQAYGALRRLVRPYILRRMKTDPTIVPDLPQKTEMRVECGLSKKQAALYERAVAELARRLRTADGMARRGLVLSTLMQLKQICNHPAQYLGSSKFAPDDSAKFDRLRLLCEPIAERQEKMLVFTQFQSLTQPLADFLETVLGHPGLVLHGGTPVGRRQQLVQEFQSDGGPPFFVISLKAGGSGLNLTAASHVVHFDRWWNPAVENQATDRAFRIGQKRNVLVHKFVCRSTVEERIDAMIHDKQAVADQILGEEGGETRLSEMPDEELLKFVALDISRAIDE